MAALPSRPLLAREAIVQQATAGMARYVARTKTPAGMAPGSASRMRLRWRPRARLALGFLALWAAAEGHGAVDKPRAAEIASLRAEARAYEHGEGVVKSAARAVDLYCKAARLGDAEAQYSLGWMYANGRGVARDDAMAALFFRLAAAQGHDHASRMLHYLGDEVAQKPECLRGKPAVPQAKVQQAYAPPVTAEPLVTRREPGPPQLEPLVSHEEADTVDTAMASTPVQKQIAELVNKLAPQYGVSPRLAFAVIRFESNFDPLARSEKNAQGLMQLIPETAARFNVAKPFDPVQNLRGGLAYLRWLLAYFRGNVPLVVAAYNAGEGAVNRHRGIPPFAETRAYVSRVLSLFGRNEHPYDPAVTAPSPELHRIRRR